MSGKVISGERELSIEELAQRAAKAAKGLEELGVNAGDAVAILMRNDIPFIEATMAARMMGAFPVPINWHCSPDEVGYILHDCAAKVLVAHTDLLNRIIGHIPEKLEIFAVPTPPDVQAVYGLSPDSCSIPSVAVQWSSWLEEFSHWSGIPKTGSSMIYTSGTTGRPKGVRRNPPTEQQNLTAAQKYSTIFGIASGMRTIIPAPMYHAAPNAYALLAAQAGGTIVLQSRFDPEQFLQLIEEHAISHIQVVPTMFVRLLKLPEDIRNQYDVSSLKHIVHAAAPCPPEVKKAMIDWWGPVINEYYGSTEAQAVTYCTSEDALMKPGTVGRALPTVTLKILNEGGHELPVGEVGDIYMWDKENPNFTYHNDEKKRLAMEQQGLVTNGDMGYIDEDGFLFLCDRKIDMVISGGVNIYPAEVESVLITHPGVQDCAVFGIPHPEYGETLLAVIQPVASNHPQVGQSLETGEIQAFLAEKLAGYKIPKIIEFQSVLPREESGKIFKRKLRAPYWENVERKI